MAKVYVKVGDPDKPKEGNDMVLTPKRAKAEADLDLRDALSLLAIKGNALNPDDKAALYSNLTTTLGKDKAQKLLNHAYIFNSRPDMQRLTPEEKLRSFYAIGSNDPDVMEVIGRTKNLGYGVLPGFRESISAGNQSIQAGTYNTAPAVAPEEIKKKVMVRVGK
jgi:hypothetical protein